MGSLEFLTTNTTVELLENVENQREFYYPFN